VRERERERKRERDDIVIIIVVVIIIIIITVITWNALVVTAIARHLQVWTSKKRLLPFIMPSIQH
jgi:hypothetical protein